LIDELTRPCLVTWAVEATDLARKAAGLAPTGMDLGPVSSGGRRRPDGSELRWEVTDPGSDRAGGVIPFLIDWLGTPHPARSLGHPCELLDLTLKHPQPAEVRECLDALDLDIRVTESDRAALAARVRTAGGIVELR
jgi:hypothetical protein